ncbi:putative protein-L-isoaspartate O-methyltransferase [Grifola frondosa]|uniref:protein-L-isoaspartate(D-aspartate) O-methyltransferase n=1 Tax=Grifola frondosa TaxID=5627 RepID=A0A1C7LVF3_GRIFR|nr:putative protein-L-isoaspartate O-methyltransferase [Grifola frondosa]
MRRKTSSQFLKPGARVLDVGSGSGYLCAIFYHLVAGDPKVTGAGKVVGIEHIPQLVEWSVGNLRKDGLGTAVDEGRIEMVAGDGRQGYAKEDVPVRRTKALVEQLARPGRMFIPVGIGSQQIIQDEEGRVTETTPFNVMQK